MSTSTKETKEQELARLKIEYADVFNNPAIKAIANWRDPLDYLAQSQPEQSEEQYMTKFEKNLPALKRLMDSTEGNSVSDSYKRINK